MPAQQFLYGPVDEIVVFFGVSRNQDGLLDFWYHGTPRPSRK
jgi:hypothetical protein